MKGYDGYLHWINLIFQNKFDEANNFKQQWHEKK